MLVFLVPINNVSSVPFNLVEIVDLGEEYVISSRLQIYDWKSREKKTNDKRQEFSSNSSDVIVSLDFYTLTLNAENVIHIYS